MSINAYQTAARIKEDPREAEYRIFVQVTAALERHAADQTATSGLAEAVHDNRRLWNALADDLTEEANRFDDRMKAGLISLALWVNRESGNVVAGRTSVRALIEVNRIILRGLAPTVAGAGHPEGSMSHGAYVKT